MSPLLSLLLSANHRWSSSALSVRHNYLDSKVLADEEQALPMERSRPIRYKRVWGGYSIAKQTNVGYVDDAGESRKILKIYAAGSAMRGDGVI